MYYYLLPVQSVLLEYVIKLGEVIFFPASARNEDITRSSLTDDEQVMLKGILEKNYNFFKKVEGYAFLLISSEFDSADIQSDVNILERIFTETNRKLDYIRILQCPFIRPEYFLGIPGLSGTKKYLISINEDMSMGLFVEGDDYFYSMQKGLGLDIGANEKDDVLLYNILFSDRKDEVYNTFRNYIGEACEALRIIDESRCFVYLFSKVDGMGLCDEYQFTQNKIRILSVIAKTQHEFELLSSELYFFSKEIRTEVIHKGRKIDEIVSLDEARGMNQQLFNIIIKFCVDIINTGIDDIEILKTYISNQVGKYNYVNPEDKQIAELPSICYPTTTYIAEVEGIDIKSPEKRGNYIIVPKSEYYDFHNYYDNYVKKETGEDCEEEFQDFTVEDLEYIIEILLRIGDKIHNTPIVIGLKLPRIMENYMNSIKLREMVVDYICNKINTVFYYDILCGGEVVNGRILPPRIGIRDGIRAIYEFVETEKELYVRPIPGRVFGEYELPEQEYKCVQTYKHDIYNILFSATNYMEKLRKRVLVNLCETEYVFDWTQRISFLFDIFDSLDSRHHDKEKVIKLVFVFLATDRNDYLNRKQYYTSMKDKYRNPILHGGHNIFEIEGNYAEIEKLDLYLRNVILEFCLKLHSMGIGSWEEMDLEYKNQQKRLKLI